MSGAGRQDERKARVEFVVGGWGEGRKHMLCCIPLSLTCLRGGTEVNVDSSAGMACVRRSAGRQGGRTHLVAIMFLCHTLWGGAARRQCFSLASVSCYPRPPASAPWISLESRRSAAWGGR